MSITYARWVYCFWLIFGSYRPNYHFILSLTFANFAFSHIPHSPSGLPKSCCFFLCLFDLQLFLSLYRLDKLSETYFTIITAFPTYMGQTGVFFIYFCFLKHTLPLPTTKTHSSFSQPNSISLSIFFSLNHTPSFASHNSLSLAHWWSFISFLFSKEQSLCHIQQFQSHSSDRMAQQPRKLQ